MLTTWTLSNTETSTFIYYNPLKNFQDTKSNTFMAQNIGHNFYTQYGLQEIDI